MKIGLVSDTHVPASLPSLPRTLADALRGVDRILHAGDLVSADVLTALSRIAPVDAVHGNCDPPELVRRLPEWRIETIHGARIGLHHGRQSKELEQHYLRRDLDYAAPETDLFFTAMIERMPSTDVIVFGHFHLPVITRRNGVLFVNPGSIAPPHRRPTYALLHLDGAPRAEILDL